MHLIVDVMNVIGSRPDGWWRDRPAAAQRLVVRLRRLAAERGDEVVAVLDGRPLPGLPEGEDGGVRVLYGGGCGPNAADRRIVEFVASAAAPRAWTVVTSDAALAHAVRALRVDGARAWRERLDALGDASGV